MSKPRQLTRLLAPSAGISLPSYVESLASMYKVNLLVMLKYLGVLTDEKFAKLNGYGVMMDPLLIQNFAWAARLTEQRVNEMLLVHYDGICLDLGGIYSSEDALRKLSVSEWAYFSGSHACPDCMADEITKGVWQLKWKLPWSFACVKHKCYLIANCPQCERRLASGRVDHSLSPLFVKFVPQPGLCNNPQKTGEASIGKGAVPCGHPLGSIPTVGASRRAIALQKNFDMALLNEPQTSMGIPVSAFEYFDDVKGLCVLLLHAATLDMLGNVSPPEVKAFQLFASERDQKGIDRAQSITPRNEGRTRVLFGVPKDPILVAAIASVAVEILASASVSGAAELMRPLAREVIDKGGKNRWALGKSFHFSERLNNALHEALSPTSSFDRTMGNMSVAAHDAVYTFEPKHVPQLFWESDFDIHFAKFFPGTKANYARRFCSMSLVKLCGTFTWKEAAELLDLPVDSAVKMANKAVGLLAEGVHKKKFAKLLHEIAKRLSADSERLDYLARRRKLRNLTDIPKAKWAILCEESGTTVGQRGGRKTYAAAWLWADLTGSDWILAPGLQEGNITNMREVFRQLDKTLFPTMAPALRQYGNDALLKL